MSRSYKKHPAFRVEDCHFGKREAARRVRHYDDILPDGGYYKRLARGWVIDQWDYLSQRDNERYGDVDEERWRKCYYRK